MDRRFHKNRKGIQFLYFFQFLDMFSWNPLLVYRKFLRSHSHFFVWKDKVKGVDIFIFPTVFPEKPSHIFQAVFISCTAVVLRIIPYICIPGSSRIHIINLFQGFVQIFYCLLHPSIQDTWIIFFDHPCCPKIKYPRKRTGSKHSYCQDRQ